MTTAAKIQVNSIDYRDFISCNVSMTIDKNNSVSSMNAKFDNEVGSVKSRFNIGDEIFVFIDKDVEPPTTKVFGGLIDDVDFGGKEQKEDLTIRATDFTTLLKDNTIQPIVYTNQEVSVIVKNIIDNEVSGITTVNIQVTPRTLTRIAFNQTNCYDAIKQLAELAGFIFFIDPDKDLHFEPKSSVSSGITLNNTNIRKISTKETRDDIVNKLWIYGDRVLTNIIHPFTANGGSVITLNNKPFNTQVTVTGASIQGGGIFKQGQIPVSGQRYLVNFDDMQIIFTSGTQAGDNIPTSGNTGSITYDKINPIVKFGERADSIGSFGPKEIVIQDKNIKDPDTAVDFTNTILDEKSQPAKQVLVDVDGIVAITPGNTLIIDYPHHNINAQTYDVLEVTYTLTAESMQEDNVLSVKLNKRISNTLDVIKQIILDLKKVQAGDIDAADVFTRLQSGIDNYGFNIIDWKVKTNNIGNSFILNHPINGILGSPATSIAGSQVVLGDQKEGLVIIESGVT